ncbi:hypothetical protein ACJX0J_036292 [Zea mays]
MYLMVQIVIQTLKTLGHIIVFLKERDKSVFTLIVVDDFIILASLVFPFTFTACYLLFSITTILLFLSILQCLFSKWYYMFFIQNFKFSEGCRKHDIVRDISEKIMTSEINIHVDMGQLGHDL